MCRGSRTVVVLGPLFEPPADTVRERLGQAGADLLFGETGRTEDDVIAAARGADVVMAFGPFPFTERVFGALPRLGFLQQCTVGYERIDLEAATRHGVMVANSPLFCMEEVSDHAAMLLLACARKLPHQLAAAAAHGWNRTAAVTAMGEVSRLKGKILGFVGFGRIARLTAEKLHGFGLTYLAHDPYVTPEQVTPWRVELVGLDELCRRSDVVSMHAPLTASTEKMLGEAQFRAMKPTACFVNTSRGATVDEAALTRALSAGWIAGAGLDVLATEPPDPANRLLGLPNVLLTPHTAGYSADSMADNRVQTLDEVLRVLGGKEPTALLNPEVRAHARLPARVPA